MLVMVQNKLNQPVEITVKTKAGEKKRRIAPLSSLGPVDSEALGEYTSKLAARGYVRIRRA